MLIELADMLMVAGEDMACYWPQTRSEEIAPCKTAPASMPAAALIELW